MTWKISGVKWTQCSYSYHNDSAQQRWVLVRILTGNVTFWQYRLSRTTTENYPSPNNRIWGAKGRSANYNLVDRYSPYATRYRLSRITYIPEHLKCANHSHTTEFHVIDRYRNQSHYQVAVLGHILGSFSTLNYRVFLFIYNYSLFLGFPHFLIAIIIFPAAYQYIHKKIKVTIFLRLLRTHMITTKFSRFSGYSISHQWLILNHLC